MTSVMAFGELENGHVFLEDQNAYLRDLMRLPDGPVRVTVETARGRTDQQNKAWHAVVVNRFAEHCGEDHDAMHEILKGELLATKRAIYGKKTGVFIKEVTVVGSTTDLSTVEFNDLIARAQRLGASMNLYIPDPDPNWKAMQ